MIIFEDRRHDITISEYPTRCEDEIYTVQYVKHIQHHKSLKEAYKDAIECIDHALRCEGVEIEELA